MTDIEMLPLPEHFAHQSERVQEHVRAYARAVAEHNVKERDAEIERLKVVAHGFVDEIATKDAEIEALRAEREVIGAEAVKYADKSGRLNAKVEQLTEALRKIEQGSPVEAPDLDDWSDADERVDVVENNLRWHFGKIARAALRDHDQEGTND